MNWRILTTTTLLTACGGQDFTASPLAEMPPDAGKLTSVKPGATGGAATGGATSIEATGGATSTDLASRLDTSTGMRANLSHGWVQLIGTAASPAMVWSCPQQTSCYCAYSYQAPGPFIQCLLDCGC